MPIYYGTSPTPPPGYKAVPITLEKDNVQKETKEQKEKKKQDAIRLALAASTKSNRLGVLNKQVLQTPGPSEIIRRS